MPSAAEAQAALQSFQQPDSASVLSQAQQKYGIQGLQDRVNTYKTLTGNLTGAIAAVDPSVTGRTSGTLTTEGQRSALVGRERAPIIGQLGTAQTGLEGATNDFNTADKNARGEADLTIADNKMKYDRLMQNYTMANEQEQQQAKAAQDAADRAESVRQFNASRSASAQKAATPSAAASKQQDMATIASNLESRKGKDNHVSQNDWNRALADWVKAGYGASEFVKQNIRYINQRYKGYSGFN